MRMTNQMTAAYNALLKAPDGIIRPHTLPSGAKCVRLVDKEFNPITNIPFDVLDRLKDEGLLELKTGGGYKINIPR